MVNKPILTVRILHCTVTTYLLYDQQERHTKDTMLKIYNIKANNCITYKDVYQLNTLPVNNYTTPKCCEACHNLTAYYYMSYKNMTNTTQPVQFIWYTQPLAAV